MADDGSGRLVVSGRFPGTAPGQLTLDGFGLGLRDLYGLMQVDTSGVGGGLGFRLDVRGTAREPLIEGNRVAFFWHFRGTLTGEFFGALERGKRVEFSGAAEYLLSPDGIVSARHVFDFTGSLVSAGVLRVKPV